MNVVNARAFTVRQDVMFGAGEYASGQRLQAHELPNPNRYPTVEIKPNGDVIGSYDELVCNAFFHTFKHFNNMRHNEWNKSNRRLFIIF